MRLAPLGDGVLVYEIETGLVIRFDDRLQTKAKLPEGAYILTREQINEAIRSLPPQQRYLSKERYEAVLSFIEMGRTNE